MSTYEIKTPILKTIGEGLLGVFEQAINGKADLKQGELAVRSGTGARMAVESDLKVRLSSAKLAKIEA